MTLCVWYIVPQHLTTPILLQRFVESHKSILLLFHVTALHPNVNLSSIQIRTSSQSWSIMHPCENHSQLLGDISSPGFPILTVASSKNVQLISEHL